MIPVLSPFHLLEINLISAQDLTKVSRTMKTYAMTWVHRDRKLTTRVDDKGGANPTWNDKFVFRVDENFLKSDTSAVMIEIYALHWFRDVHVGTVRVLVSNLIPPQIRSPHHHNLGMRFVALQVRRPSGRPQGILNIGVTVLDSTMRSMPLYTQLSTSALGYQQLMGTEDLHHHHHGSSVKGSVTAQLRRTKSERSSLLGIDDELSQMPKSTIKGSTIKGGSTITIKGSEVSAGRKGKLVYDKPLSVIEGASDLAVQLDMMNTTRAISTTSHSPVRAKTKPKARKITSSLESKSDLGITPKKKEENIKKSGSDLGAPKKDKPKNSWLTPAAEAANRNTKGYGKGHPQPKDFANGSAWSQSEVGPSPSEVALAIAEDVKHQKLNGGKSSLMLNKWSMDGSEGLKTKLERWRTDLPTLNDYSSFTSSTFKPKHARWHSNDATDGKFSCFGNIGGFECSIVCGRSAPKRRVVAKPMARALSMDSMSTYL
ncbi:hypothetical protein Nepgr_021907 [Nepenthes gracilis]|uniref:C2 domain-containing protein n=1 Tax=Nepenthes gracilis TaxID=150966 RepID=A0AAD3SZT0_NEPGR|nr:hypothetical protein Nepgr_021907 [Nepenthes gracilis]